MAHSDGAAHTILNPTAQGGMPSQEQVEEQEEQQRAAEERRQAMLAAVLQPAARERCTLNVMVESSVTM